MNTPADKTALLSLVWAIFYALASMGFGIVITRIFKLPSWVTPALAFNNTTSLPLLLIQALDTTGILSALLESEDDNSSKAIKRAKSYFLVCAMVSNTLAFVIGPKLLDGEEGDEQDDSRQNKNRVENGNGQANGQANSSTTDSGPEDLEQGDEQTPLLPAPIVRTTEATSNHVVSLTSYTLAHLPTRVQKTLTFLSAFASPIVFGALIGAIIGLTPPLHRAFFNEEQDGGIFNAWLTTSISNIGDLFAALQVVIVGVKLSASLRKMKRGESSGRVPWRPALLVLFVRFVVWPAVSILFVYLLASKTNVLGKDPILWFAMMLMPTGPPAMSITSLAEVSGGGEEEKESIAKFLTIAYIVSPAICVTVVGSLKAAENAVG